jgi:hypothetical protein
MKGVKETDNQIICKYCGRIANSRFSNNAHQVLCKSNPNRIESYAENWTEEKRVKHSAIMKERNTNKLRIYSEEDRQKMGLRSKAHNAKYWTPEHRQEHSEKMSKVVLQRPESYSSKNVCGRTKGIPFLDSYGNHVVLNGKWELCVVEYFNNNNIKWTKKIDAFPYLWKNTWHLYFPDFLLTEFDKYIEVKGFERERDRCKWRHFPHKLIILKQKEIKQIMNKTFNINTLRAGGTDT